MKLTLTTTAISAILKALPEPADNLRISVRGGGCSGFQYVMNFENAAELSPTDKVIEYGQVTVVVDQISAMYLDGVEIDYNADLMQSGFSFHNENATSTCGCGKSFSS